MSKIEKVIILFVTLVIAICIYVQDYDDKKVEQARELRLNNIETKLEQHTHYIDDLEADVDNLKEVVRK